MHTSPFEAAVWDECRSTVEKSPLHSLTLRRLSLHQFFTLSRWFRPSGAAERRVLPGWSWQAETIGIEKQRQGRHCRRSWFPPFAQNAKDGAPTLLLMDAKSRCPPLRFRSGQALSLRRTERLGRGTRLLTTVTLRCEWF